MECYVIALQELSVPELRRFDQQMREEIALAAMADDLDVVRQMAKSSAACGRDLTAGKQGSSPC